MANGDIDDRLQHIEGCVCLVGGTQTLCHLDTLGQDLTHHRERETLDGNTCTQYNSCVLKYTHNIFGMLILLR